MGLCKNWTLLRAIRKLRGEVDWSWKRVGAPLWIAYSLLAVVAAVLFLDSRFKR